MITMKTDQLMNGMFVRVLQKIAATPVDPYAAYRIKKAVTNIQDAQNKIRHRYSEEIKLAHGERDEKGNIIPDEAGTGFKVKDPEAFDKAAKEFGERDVDLPINKIRFEDIARINMSASEIEMVFPILEEPKNQD